MRVMGIDASLRNTGLVLADLDLDRLTFSVQDMYLVETKEPTTKRVRKNSDDLERARRISNAIETRLEGVSMVFVEMPVGSKSARAMASYGICLGVLSNIEQPLIQLTPYQVKEFATGDKTASKAQMIEWAVSQHGEANWLKRGAKLLNKNEHLADACAAIHAGLQTEDFRSALAILRFVSK